MGDVLTNDTGQTYRDGTAGRETKMNLRVRSFALTVHIHIVIFQTLGPRMPSVLKRTMLEEVVQCKAGWTVFAASLDMKFPTLSVRPAPPEWLCAPRLMFPG